MIRVHAVARADCVLLSSDGCTDVSTLPTVSVPLTVSVCTVVASGRLSVGSPEQVEPCTTLRAAGNVWSVDEVQVDVRVSVIEISERSDDHASVTVSVYESASVARLLGRSLVSVPGWHDPPFWNSWT
jgi:hypothetical protein